jgi:tRNA A58 N-methylase Trm61
MINWLLAFPLIIIFLVFLRIYESSGTIKYGAPFFPLDSKVIGRIMNLADLKKGEIFYDLGSGDGRLVIAAALRGAKAYGIEIDRFRAWYSRLRISLLGLKDKATIIQKNFFEVDLSEADVITSYLLQKTNDRLIPKLNKEVKKGARVLGIAFSFSGWQPTKIDKRGTKYGPIYLYRR